MQDREPCGPFREVLFYLGFLVGNASLFLDKQLFALVSCAGTSRVEVAVCGLRLANIVLFSIGLLLRDSVS